MLTGQAEETAIENAKKHAGLYAHITKPWTQEQLERVIRNGLSEIEE